MKRFFPVFSVPLGATLKWKKLFEKSVTVAYKDNQTGGFEEGKKEGEKKLLRRGVF